MANFGPANSSFPTLVPVVYDLAAQQQYANGAPIGSLTISQAAGVQRAMVGGYAPVGVLARSAVAIPLTGTTSATQLAAVTIPAGSLGPNGGLRVTAITSETNNVNSKTFIVRLSGTPFYQAGATSITGRRVQFEIWNRGATGSQLGFATSVGTSLGNFTQPYVTTSFDTAGADQTVQFIASLAVGTDTFTLEAFMVELLYGA